MEIAALGTDLASPVLEPRGREVQGTAVSRKSLRLWAVLDVLRDRPSCPVGLEACGSSHHRMREIAGLGHVVGMIPPVHVGPQGKRQENDAADAEAIGRAASGPEW